MGVGIGHLILTDDNGDLSVAAVMGLMIRVVTLDYAA